MDHRKNFILFFQMTLKETYNQTIKLLKENGFHHLVTLLEKTYEHNPHKKGSDKYIMWQEQCAINLPILYLGSLYLRNYGTNPERDYRRYLFATRDCCHWYRIFQKMYPEVEVHYFRCSRNMFDVARSHRRPEYHNYVKALADKHSVYVDIHGTGNHMVNYFQENFNYVIPCFFMSSGFDDYSELPKLCRRLHSYKALHTIVLGINGSPIEMLNYDKIGTLQDYNKDGPILDKCEYDVRLVEPYHQCVQYFIDHLGSIDRNDDIEKIRSVLKKLFVPIRKTDMKPSVSHYIVHEKKHRKLIK